MTILLLMEHSFMHGQVLRVFVQRGEDPSDCPTDGDKSNPTIDFSGEKRKNETHSSTTDPESRLMRKSFGDKAKLSYGTHALMENRNGLLVDIMVTRANRSSEWDACEDMLIRQKRKGIKPKTLGGDKGYDTRGFVSMLKKREITPHVSQNSKRKGGSAIDNRTTRHLGYTIIQRIRKRVEELFGWMKTIGGFRKNRFRGRCRTQLQAWFVGTAYNLLRMAKLIPQEAAV